jgi:hypothetical protein
MSDDPKKEPKKERQKKPPLIARIRARWPDIRAIYFSFDPRSVGLARIGLGLLLLYDLWRRVDGIPTWYTNDGLLPNHAVLWRPDSDYLFSFFFAASTTAEAAVLFVLVALVYLCFLVGWHTRLFHLLSLACLVSVHSRGTFLENGGDVALNLLCGWTLFLPMGVRFSVDAVRASLEVKRERTVGELALRDAWRERVKRPVISLAVLAILLQLSVMYYFNAVHKHGWTWREGKAIHYVLYQERMVTWFGVLVRRYMTLPLSMVMTYATLVIEIAAPLLILNPMRRYRTRSIAILLYPALHLAFAAFLNLGQFSFNMIGYFPLLLSAQDWQLINRFVAPAASRARTVVFDPLSPLLAGAARLLARLDAFDRLKFEALEPNTPADAGVAAEPSARFTVMNPVTGERATGVMAIAECFGALALGRPWAWLLRTGVGQKAGRSLLDWIARHERAIESSFALEPMTAGDVVAPLEIAPAAAPPSEAARAESELVSPGAVPEPATESAATPATAAASETPAAPASAPAPAPAARARIPRHDEPDQGPPVRRWLRRRTTEVRELTLAVLVVVVASQVLMENKAVPPQLKWGQPKWMQQILGYPRMFQGWGMFSSDVPVGERMLYVDAVTFSGRHVDPFNEAGSRVATLPVERIPPHMEQDEFWCDYTNRIPERQVYWRMLKEWIMAYHLRTMKREDRVISFEAKLIESDSPPPGEFEARNIRTKVMMTDRDP